MSWFTSVYIGLTASRNREPKLPARVLSASICERVTGRAM